VISAALGLVAPVSGAHYDRLGAKLLRVCGMAVVPASLLALSVVLDGHFHLLPLATGALAVLGLGQGLFTAPSNAAVMGLAAAGETGQAGGFLNMVRSLGMSLGITLTSAIVASQLPLIGGRPRASEATLADLIRAGTLSFRSLAVLAVAVAVLMLVWRRRQRR
jgi:hypothetical protein